MEATASRLGWDCDRDASFHSSRFSEVQKAGRLRVHADMKRFDIAEMFVHASREAWRNDRHRNLTICFDYRGPSPIILGDHERAYQGLRRLLSGAAQMIDVGFLEFDGEARLTSSGAVELCIKAVGCGSVAGESRVREMLPQLAMDFQPMSSGEPAPSPRLRRGTGRCPVSGMEIELSMIPSIGFILKVKSRWPAVQVVGLHTTRRVLSQSRVWVIDENSTTGATMVRRLRRASCTAIPFSSCADAERRLRSAMSHDDPPRLVLFMEPRDRPLQGRDALLRRLPAGTRCIWIVEPGVDPSAEAVEVRVQPLSPNDLEQFAGVIAGTHIHR